MSSSSSGPPNVAALWPQRPSALSHSAALIINESAVEQVACQCRAVPAPLCWGLGLGLEVCSAAASGLGPVCGLCFRGGLRAEVSLELRSSIGLHSGMWLAEGVGTDEDSGLESAAAAFALTPGARHLEAKRASSVQGCQPSCKSSRAAERAWRQACSKVLLALPIHVTPWSRTRWLTRSTPSPLPTTTSSVAFIASSIVITRGRRWTPSRLRYGIIDCIVTEWTAPWPGSGKNASKSGLSGSRRIGVTWEASMIVPVSSTSKLKAASLSRAATMASI
mmetsp:Transcript_117268/g.204182  ORF Transcript_117268/g.204182 Transcript_117268/m.204182 type:complete len:278 (+) Transcript_117268:409-1242(+)